MNVERIFLAVFNMSITASWMVAVVVLLRQFLHGFPRIFSYLLWAVVYFRLLCPFSYTSVASLINLLGTAKNVSVPLAIVAERNGPVVASSINWMMSANNEAIPYLFQMSLVWLIGVTAMLLYGLYSYVKLRKMVKSALPMSNGIYMCSSVDVPFVLGVFKPRIYLPAAIKDEEYNYILNHEQIHILRKDYIIKPIAYLALSLHWFNPLVWLSMRMMTCDMEMSCDEMVLHKMGESIKRSYSNSLLRMASEKPSSSLHMLAFGETDTKRRIKNVLNYKNPIGKKIAVAVCLVAVVSMTMLANPAAAYANDKPIEHTPSIIVEPAPTPLPAQEEVIEATELEPTPAPEEVVVTPLPGEVGDITLYSPLGEQGYISAGLYGYAGHSGTDFAAPAGTEIYAAGSGTVVYASNEVDALRGRHVIVDHGDGWQTLYAHCSKVLVEVDDVVTQGSLIAKVGRTGNATGTHCHVELRYNGEIANLTDYIVEAE